MGHKIEHDFTNLPNIQGKKDIAEFFNAKKETLKNKLVKKNDKKSGYSAWVIVFLLMISLVSLGTYTLNQIRENNETMAKLKERNQVAGVSGEQTFLNPPISGYGFTILPQEKEPAGFNLERETIKSMVFPQRSAVFSSYISEQIRDGKKMKTGIEIEVLEYDNKFSAKEFAQMTQKILGDNFQIVSEEIILPRGFKIAKITDKEKVLGIEYFTAVTTDNYYFIKVYNQLENYSEFAEQTRFTSNILQWLYLN